LFPLNERREAAAGSLQQMTEPSDGRRMTRLDVTAPALVRSVAFGTGSDGRLLLASAGGDGTARLWEVATGRLLAASALPKECNG
jgi:WD40 repeat protein